jgi:ABC-type transport system involved in cytochrome bd biosynthesis fused ATPase/permease subunit
MASINRKIRTIALLSGVLLVSWGSLIALVALAEKVATVVPQSFTRSLLGILILAIWGLLVIFLVEAIRRKIASSLSA